MGATLQFAPDRRDAFGLNLAISLALHGLLFGSASIISTRGLHFGGRWGRMWNTGDSARVNTVASLPGVPLPTPMITTPSTVVTQNPGLYQEEPQPKPEPTPQAEQIPKFKETAKPEKVQRVNKRIQKQTLEMPENIIPYGQGGKPSMTYSQFVTAASEGGIKFGNENFGARYGWYVAGVRNRISSNWLLAMISPTILSAPRVYLTFDILRDGTVTNVQITHSSGMPEVDRSALRAVLASNPLGPLPPDYVGDRVSVEFYFDFRR